MASSLCLLVVFLCARTGCAFAFISAESQAAGANLHKRIAKDYLLGPWTLDGWNTTRLQHRVEHVEILDSVGFWILMATVVIAMGAVVVKVQVNDEAKPLNVKDSLPAPGGAAATAEPYYHNMAHAVIATVALTISMLLWGLAQEFVMTHAYECEDAQMETIPSSLFIVLCNRLMSVAFCSLLLVLLRRPFYVPGVFQYSILPAQTNFLSSWCQYDSLAYISFTLQTTAKSAKLLPVLVISSCRGKSHTFTDYVECLVIVMALFVFCLETDAGDREVQTTVFGILLLCGLLLFDALTPHLQDVLFERNTRVDTVQAVFAISVVAGLTVLLIQLCSGSLLSCLVFLSRHPVALLHLAVLSGASTMTVFMITYTIKHFGPVAFALISSSRQALSICLSAALFNHHISPLAWVALVLLFGTLTIRALQPVFAAKNRWPTPESLESSSDASRRTVGDGDGSPRAISESFTPWPIPKVPKQLLMCTLAIHTLYGIYGISEEFLSVHTFKGELFAFPLFIVAVNHSCGAVVALGALKLGGMPVLVPKLYYTLCPAACNLLSSYSQHKALYLILFPAQTLMKTLRMIPVMLIGRLLRNRTYSGLDYIEGGLITGLVAWFVIDFEKEKNPLQYSAGFGSSATLGILMMLVYVLASSFTNNLEDFVYQTTSLDPGQMLFGMELSSAICSWAILLLDHDQLFLVAHFLIASQETAIYVVLQAMTSACGAYACTITVRLFGPAVFTLLMTSRHVLSLVLSVYVFQHQVSLTSCLCLVGVAFLMIAASVRRVSDRSMR